MAVVLMGVPGAFATELRSRLRGITLVDADRSNDLIESLAALGQTLDGIVVGSAAQTDAMLNRIEALGAEIPIVRLDNASLDTGDATPSQENRARLGQLVLTDASPDEVARVVRSAIEKVEPDSGNRLGEYVEALLDRAPVGFVVVDADGAVVAWNRTAADMLNVVGPELAGAPFTDLFPTSPGVREFISECLAPSREPEPRTFMRRTETGEQFVRVIARRLPIVAQPTVSIVLEDVTTRHVAEAERNKLVLDLAFLSDASSILASSLDYYESLEGLARLAVGHIGEWCSILVEDDGILRRVALVHADPAHDELVSRLMVFPADPSSNVGHGPVFRTGRPAIVADVVGELLQQVSSDDQLFEQVRSLGLAAGMIVPLRARGRVLGTMSFGSADPQRRYSDEDLALAQELARRAGAALDNALLVREVQRAEERFRTLIQSLDAIFWEAERESLQYSFVSQRAEGVLGYPVERWLEDPKLWTSIIHPDDRDRAIAGRRDSAQTGLDRALEYRLMAADGRILWVRDIVHVARDQSDPSRGLRGVMIDVTDQKLVEQELEFNRARFARTAEQLQRSLLPPELPQLPGVEVAAFYRPAGQGNEVGGDFYDAFEVDKKEWAIAIGDVCGKGPEAAAVTALARYTVRAAALNMRRPVRILHALNEAILRQGGNNDRFCSVAYVRLKKGEAGLRATVSVAGHPVPLIVRAGGEIEAAGEPGLVLGVLEELDSTEESFVLSSGDTIVLYTDGVTDAGAPDDPLGDEGLHATLRGGAPTAAELAARIQAAVLERSGRTPRDDCAVVAVRVH